MSAEPDVIAISRQLIRTPSMNPGGDERAVADLVTELSSDLGLPTPRRLAREPHRPNLLTTIDFGPGGRHLVLCGHLDTKPIGDAEWTVDPLAADVDGDRLYGLGSGDMKAGVAAILVAAHQLVSGSAPRSGLAGRLSLLFTADEEAGAAFGGHFLRESGGIDADAMVIAEPGGLDTDFDALHLVSRGSARLHVSATGRQGHSSLSDSGVDPASGTAGAPDNAGVLVARAICAITDAGPVAAPPNEHGLLGWRTTLNAALAYSGGVGFGVLPGRMSAVTEVRTVPGMDPESVLAEIRHRVATVRDRARVRVTYDAAPLDWLEPTIVSPSDPVAAAASTAWTSTFSGTPSLSVFPGTTDAAWFGGPGGIPTLPALGPGLLRRAHGADEWVSVEAIRRAVDLYRHLVTAFCGLAGSDTTASAAAAAPVSAAEAAADPTDADD